MEIEVIPTEGKRFFWKTVALFYSESHSSIKMLPKQVNTCKSRLLRASRDYLETGQQGGGSNVCNISRAVNLNDTPTKLIDRSSELKFPVFCGQTGLTKG